MFILGCGMMSQVVMGVPWGRGQLQHQVTSWRTQQQKMSMGRVLDRGNYEFLTLEIRYLSRNWRMNQ